MALLIRIPRSSQPSSPCGVNWGHPSAQGLKRCWTAFVGNPNVGAANTQMYDAVYGVSPIWTSGVAGGQLTAWPRSARYQGGPGCPLLGISFPSGASALAHFDGGTWGAVTGAGLSAMALIKPGNVTSRGDIVGRWFNGSTAGDQFLLSEGAVTNGKVRFDLSDGTGGQSSGDATTAITTTDAWMIGGSVMGKTVTCYVNGRAENSATGTKTMTTAPTANYRLGANGQAITGGYEGDLYFAAVWNRALSPVEFWALARNPWVLFEAMPDRVFINSIAGASFNPAWAAAANSVIQPGALQA